MPAVLLPELTDTTRREFPAVLGAAGLPALTTPDGLTRGLTR